jgi:hypothetical protein
MLNFVGCIPRATFVTTLLAVFYAPPADPGKRPSFSTPGEEIELKMRFNWRNILPDEEKTRSLDLESVLPVNRNMTHPKFKDVSG